MANAETSLNIEVVYARPDVQELLPLVVPAGSTLLDAVRLSGLPARFPEIDLENGSFGIFGKIEKSPQTRQLQSGDRVEIYRPLLIDPKEARKARAAKLKAKREAGG